MTNEDWKTQNENWDHDKYMETKLFAPIFFVVLIIITRFNFIVTLLLQVALLVLLFFAIKLNNNHWNRIYLIVLSVVGFLVCGGYWRDLPNYINKEYSIVEGVPSYVKTQSRGGVKFDLVQTITINGVNVKLNVFNYFKRSDLNQILKVTYLPRTGYAVHVTKLQK